MFCVETYYGGSAMGPYYRGTSQSVGQFFDLFYNHPILMLMFFASAVGLGFFFWKSVDGKNKDANQ